MPAVYSDTLTHDACLVWLTPVDRDVVPVGAVAMRTAPPPTVFDALAAGEAVTVRVGTALAVADDSPADEAVGVTLPPQVRVADAATASEAVSGLLSVVVVAVADERPPGEGVVAALPLPGVSVADSLSPEEHVAVRMGLSVADTVVADDRSVIVLPTAAVGLDTVAVGEAVAVTLNVLTVRVGDDVVVGEFADRQQPVTLVAADTVVVGERRVAEVVKPKKVKIKNPNANPNAATRGV